MLPHSESLCESACNIHPLMQCHHIDLFKYQGTRPCDVTIRPDVQPQATPWIFTSPLQPYMPMNVWRPYVVQSFYVAICVYLSLCTLLPDHVMFGINMYLSYADFRQTSC